jgi:hypothetical protein
MHNAYSRLTSTSCRSCSSHFVNSGDHIAKSHNGAMRYGASALIHALALCGVFAQARHRSAPAASSVQTKLTQDINQNGRH